MFSNLRVKIRVILLLALGFSGVAGLMGGGEISIESAARDARYFHIGTGAASGVYFTIGQALAALISRPPGAEECDRSSPCGVTDLIGVAEVSEGSAANLIDVNSGRLDSALAQADLADSMVRGLAPSGNNERLLGVRAIANLYPESIHVMVSKQAKIRDFTGLKGKRVSIGPMGSGSHAEALMLFKAHGLQLEDVTALYEPPGKSADMLLAGQLDAMIYVTGFPAYGLSEAASSGKVELLPLQGAPIDQLLKANRMLHTGVIPAGVYQGQAADVPTLTVNAQWIVNSEIDEATVYQNTRALWDPRNRSLLLAAHVQAKAITPQTALSDVTIPLHPGALRYYREAGMLPQGNTGQVTKPASVADLRRQR